MKYMAKRGKIAVKKWEFRGKSGNLGAKKLRVGGQIERQNGAKCRLYA